MSNIHKHSHLLLNCLGTVGSIVSGYISEYMTEEDIKKINSKITKLNDKLKNLDIFKYKIVNRIKIRNLLVKTLSEDDEIFIDLAIKLLELSEDNFENIVDSFITLTKNDIDVLYYNLWKKRNNDKFDLISLKEEIMNNYEFSPDLIMSYEYRVNKKDFISNKNGLIVGENLTLMPNLESSNIFNVFEKLSYNNFIKLSKYIPNIKKDFFETYLCFNFTYIGIYLCNIMESLELKRKEIKNMNNYIIIHGSFGSKDGNWFPWLKEQLEKRGKQVLVPQMPVGVGNQNFENWSNVLNQLDINENTVIIAHSIAPIFICKYLITNKIKVKKLIFVCGFNNYLGIDSDFDVVNKPMFIDNFEDIKHYCNDIVCYYSDNDPYVKYDVEKEFADKLTNKQYIIKNGGHINSETGYTKFEEILNEL